jgi:signal transduction histidine kinase
MLFSGGRLDSWVGFAWTGGMIPVGLSIVGFSAYGAWKLRSGSAYALVLAEAIAASAGIHDYLVAWDGAFRLPEFTREWMAHRIFLLHHGANLLLLVMVGILTLRFVRALDSTEELNRSLEARVAEREHELEARHARLRELEREQAVLDERQRIVQDLHDGLGSQLFTALSRAERGGLDAQELAQVLRECIADMRLVFDATAPEAREPAAVLRDFLARWELLLREAGVRLTAHIELPAGAPLPPTTVVQLLRVMQEALTNALKHAAASEVRVGLERVGDALELTIADDGRGFAVDSLQPGRGLLSMRRRARTLGARLELSSGAGGTALALRLPRGGDAG